MKHDKDHDVCRDATFIQWDHYSKLSLQALRVAMATKGRILLLLLFEKRLTSASLPGTSNSVDYQAVEKEILKVMVDSQPFWPGEIIFFYLLCFFCDHFDFDEIKHCSADYGHYGPFFVRLAWHMAGSYR